MAQEQVLVRCEQIYCDAQGAGTVLACPMRVKLDGFKHALCHLYSTPGPHSDSKIAKVLGAPMVRVKNVSESAEWKLRMRLSEDDPGGARRGESELQEVA